MEGATLPALIQCNMSPPIWVTHTVTTQVRRCLRLLRCRHAVVFIAAVGQRRRRADGHEEYETEMHAYVGME